MRNFHHDGGNIPFRRGFAIPAELMKGYFEDESEWGFLFELTF